MNVGKYYVAGIPFDSENSLKHYGVKGMEWNKHKFGLDADPRFIKWINPNDINVGSYGKYGKMAEAAAKQKYGASAPAPRGRLAPVYNKQQVMDSRDSARRNMAQPWGRPVVSKEARDSQKRQREASNHQAMQEALKQVTPAKQKISAARAAEEQRMAQQKWNNSPIGRASNFVGQTTKNVGNAADRLYRESGIKGHVDNIANAITGNRDRASAESLRRTADFQADPNAPFRAQGDQYTPENLRKEADEYQKAADNALIPSAQRAAGSIGNAVSGAAQNVGDWARNAAGNAGNWAGQAAQNVGNTVTGAANAVGDWAGNAAQNVGNTVGQAAEQARGGIGGFFDRVSNAVGDAAQNVGNWAGIAAKDVGNAVGGAANKATEGAKGFLNSAGQWVSGATNNVKNTASKAASDAKKGTSGFLNSAGQWVSNAAGNVKNAAQNVGNTVGQAAQNVGNTVGQAAQNVGNTVGQAAQNVGNTVGQAAEQARGGIGGFFDRVGNAVGGAAQNVGNWAGNAAKDVGNAVSGAANAVGDWAGNAAQDVGGAVQNAGNWIGDQAQNVGGAVTGAAQNVGNAVSGAADWARNVANNVGQAAQNAGQSIVNIPQNVANWYTGQPNADRAEAIDRQVQEYERMGNMMYDNGLDNEGARYHQLAANLGRAADANQAKYDNAPRQQLSGLAGNIRNVVGTAGNAAGEWARNVGGNVGNAVSGAADWARNAAGNVGNAVSGAAGNATDWARNATGNVGNWAGQAVQNVSNIPQNIANWYTGQPNADRAEAIDRQVQEYERMGDMMYRQGLQAQGDRYHQLAANLGSVADANQARYDAAPQQRLSTAGQWVGNQAQNVADWWNRRNPFVQHSALDEKPDGVSDAFWEKFTADGGTREDYERDWR